jgi:hypothetical protein
MTFAMMILLYKHAPGLGARPGDGLPVEVLALG